MEHQRIHKIGRHQTANLEWTPRNPKTRFRKNPTRKTILTREDGIWVCHLAVYWISDICREWTWDIKRDVIVCRTASKKGHLTIAVEYWKRDARNKQSSTGRLKVKRRLNAEIIKARLRKEWESEKWDCSDGSCWVATTERIVEVERNWKG